MPDGDCSFVCGEQCNVGWLSDKLRLQFIRGGGLQDECCPAFFWLKRHGLLITCGDSDDDFDKLWPRSTGLELSLLTYKILL